MIKDEDYVIFSKGDFMKIFQVKQNKPIMIDRQKCKLDNLIDKPFGFEYEVKNQEMFLVENASIEINTAKDINKDNRNLFDNGENQKLKYEEILKLKEDNTATEIIDKLIENSASFSQKTEYSQEKYIKKKKDKYLPVYRILKPTIRNLCNVFTQAVNKRKVLNMRMDTIAQMLTYGNVAANRNVLVLESCKGLLLASIAERVGGFGKIVNLSPNGSHMASKETLDYMNFSSEYTSELYNFPLEKVDKIQEYIEKMSQKLATIENNQAFTDKLTEKIESAKKVQELFVNKQFDCLIIACKFRPLPILQKLIDSLNPSSYFVIYSQVQDSLIECLSFLKQNRKAVHVELADNWFREYQVLPERTHPKNMMDMCSGFLLSGITVSQ